MHHELKQRAIKMRLEDEMSYNAIRKKLGVAKSTLHEWLKHFPLSYERIYELQRANWDRNEARGERFRLAMAEKREQKQKAAYANFRAQLKELSREAFFVAGLMLYAAEGAKTNTCSICIANTNPEIIKFFMRWMVTFFDVPKESFKAALHLYPTMDIPKEIQFWKNELGFTDNQFYKPQIRKLKKSSFSYRESFRHGTCSLNFSSVERKTELMMAIKALLHAQPPSFTS